MVLVDTVPDDFTSVVGLEAGLYSRARDLGVPLGDILVSM